jgi:hypothetical protein
LFQAEVIAPLVAESDFAQRGERSFVCWIIEVARH